MGLFKKKVIKQIEGGMWGYLVNVYKIDVDTLSNEMRCVEREGSLDDGRLVTFARVFNLKEVAQKGITVTGWGTFDEHADLILFEGYLTKANEAYLERKRA